METHLHSVPQCGARNGCIRVSGKGEKGIRPLVYISAGLNSVF